MVRPKPGRTLRRTAIAATNASFAFDQFL
jgi:hypothetical protein